MDVRDAVSTAKRYVAEVLAEEDVTNIGLEEIRFDDAEQAWNITIGFSRPWNSLHGSLHGLPGTRVGRTYRVVKVLDEGKTVSMVKRKDMED